jgi:hypothetical protein
MSGASGGAVKVFRGSSSARKIPQNASSARAAATFLLE